MCIKFLSAEPYLGPYCPSCTLPRLSHLNTRRESTRWTEEHMWNTSSLFQYSRFLQKPSTYISGLLPLNISSPHNKRHTTHDWAVGTWTPARAHVAHKHSAWCVGCSVHTSGNDQVAFRLNFYSLYEFLQLKVETICYGAPKVLVSLTWYTMNYIVYFCLVYMLDSIFLCC